MNTFSSDGSSDKHNAHTKSIVERIVLSNVPVHKWFNIVLSVRNRDVDVYMNGRLAKRHKLGGIPRQNYGNAYLVQQSGFDGYLSRFRYYRQSLPYYKIEQIMSDGPSQAPIPELGELPPYLANDYWLQEASR